MAFKLLATRIYAPPEAEQTWRKVRSLLRIYYFAGLHGFASKKWREELGVRVDGTPGDPMNLLAEVISADRALDALRKRHVQAFTLVMADLESRCDQKRDAKHECDERCDRWFNERGTGVAQVLNLTPETTRNWYEAGKWFVWWLLDGEGSEPEEVTALLRS